jgi:hypothetical protein
MDLSLAGIHQDPLWRRAVKIVHAHVFTSRINYSSLSCFDQFTIPPRPSIEFPRAIKSSPIYHGNRGNVVIVTK